MTDYTARLGLVSAVCLGLFGGVAITWQLVIPQDPYGLWRYALLRVGALLIALPAMVIFWRVLDWATPGDWFNGPKNPEQQTLILCVLVVAIAWLLVGA